ncbi:MAG TPA: hypothetical protein VMM76_12440 [Pirellulaceae bacterium]|nr:hypothetical protein [Pirellulaceae bacterium]
MQHAQLLESVRQHVRRTFTAQGIEDADDCCETILIRDGFYCGRCFACDSHRAIWFVEENVIKFYGADGAFMFSRPLEGRSHTAVA